MACMEFRRAVPNLHSIKVRHMMAAFSRGLRSLTSVQTSDYVCARCFQFSTYSGLRSGHNRWSKIKHDKAGVDAKKNRQRSIFSNELATISKLYGGDPATNPRLATVIATAKKAGFPKASIEAAIARGQGLSTSGAALESVTLEAILPPSIALIIDIETDNRKRSLADLRVVIKNHKGTVTPTSYLFTRRGRVLFERDERGLGVDEVLDEAIEAGAEDVEADDEGNIVVWTEPSGVTAAADELGKGLDLKVKSVDLIWHPNEDTLAVLDSNKTLENLVALIDALQDEPVVQGVYTNVTKGTIEDDAWSALEEKISV